MNTVSGIALISGLGGTAGFGENSLPRNDDGSTAALDITPIFENGLNFFGRQFTTLWVNNNGSVTFNGARSAFTPTVITENNNNPEITPFFADVDTRGGVAAVSPGGNSTGSNLVYYDFDVENDRFIVTWDDVGYYSRQTNLTNAFQLILTDRQNGNFDIEFRYENISWTTGDESGGTGGLGGTVARAGFTASTGDPATSFELPASGNQAGLLALDETFGNTGQIGLWQFAVRVGDVIVSDIPALPPIGPSGSTVGDPHLVTLDGLGYDFHAVGEYVLLRDTGGSGFEVQSRMTEVGGGASVNRAVAARLEGGQVMIDSNDAVPLSIDGVATTIADFGSVNVGADRIFREGDTYTVVFAGADGIINDGDSRLIVTVYDNRVDIDVRLNTDLAGRLEGLLGDGDGDMSNDVALADGTVLERPLLGAQLYGQYRDDWRVVTTAQSLFIYDAGESLAGFYRADYPGTTTTINDFTEAEILAARQLALQAGIIEGTINFENAVFDYLLTGDASFVDGAAAGIQVPVENGIDTTPAAAMLRVGDADPNALDGGLLNDTLEGQGGNDTLRGFDGNDRLLGGEGDDLAQGGAGADYLDGGTGADTLEGGLGNDFYIVDSASDVIQGEIGFAQGGGIDTVRSFVDYTAPANIELVRLGNLADTTPLNGTGNDAPGTLVGNAGANTLNGRGGNDQINGNGGNDTLIGGEGADTLVGGTGADTFVFSSISNSRAGVANRDVINGFTRTPGDQDRIDLSAIDANTTTFGVNDAFSFIGTAAFSATGSAGQLRLVGLGGPNAVIVEADINGDRVADFQIFVNLQTTMGTGDFIL